VASGGDIGTAIRDGVTKRVALQNIKNVVVIYAENRGFDNLYGLFPGANGIPGVNPTAVGTVEPQKDFDGSALASLPPTWGGFTASGQRHAPAGQHRGLGQQAVPHRRPGRRERHGRGGGPERHHA
jgi:phospholipase C